MTGADAAGTGDSNVSDFQIELVPAKGNRRLYSTATSTRRHFVSGPYRELSLRA
jgi:hypothetical protein